MPFIDAFYEERRTAPGNFSFIQYLGGSHEFIKINRWIYLRHVERQNWGRVLRFGKQVAEESQALSCSH